MDGSIEPLRILRVVRPSNVCVISVSVKCNPEVWSSAPDNVTVETCNTCDDDTPNIFSKIRNHDAGTVHVLYEIISYESTMKVLSKVQLSYKYFRTKVLRPLSPELALMRQS